MVHEKHSDKVIDGLHLVFVELPKFTPQTIKEKKMKVLWLRYLTEIEERTKEVPQELLDNPEISKALTVVEESAYNDAQMLAYDKFWDIIRTERTFYNSAHRDGYKDGLEKGMEKGMEKGLKEGEKKKSLEVAKKLLAYNTPLDIIANSTGLSIEEIKKLKS